MVDLNPNWNPIWNPNLKADLHLHTTNSDGTDSTQEVVEILKENEIKIFSITDHDNVTSCEEMEKILLPGDMIYIPGVEFSAIHNGIPCHILAYGVDYKKLQAICNVINAMRKKKIEQVLEYIRDRFSNRSHKIISPEEEAIILNKKGTIGRYDVCEVLMKKPENEGLTRNDIYIKYLTINNLITHRILAKTIIDAIHEAGGVAILAHPGEIEEENPTINIEGFIESLITEGLDGIEVYNSIHTPEQAMKYYSFAREHNILISGGSDSHGKIKPERKIGKTLTKQITIENRHIFLQ